MGRETALKRFQACVDELQVCSEFKCKKTFFRYSLYQECVPLLIDFAEQQHLPSYCPTRSLCRVLY